MALAPTSFDAWVAPLGVRNEHLLRDLATVSVALGVAALLAATRPTWRVPVLAITLLQFTLHTLNHLLDIGHELPWSWWRLWRLGSGHGGLSQLTVVGGL
jgi:hypothetical protein